MVATLGGFYAAASFFGSLALFVYAIDAYLYFCELNSKTPIWLKVTPSSNNQNLNSPDSVITNESNNSRTILKTNLSTS